LNLERRRWLPRDLGQRYIVVNSAAFVLQVVENDSIIFRSRVVVGRADWPTPIVSATATHIVFRPTWNIPRKIAMEEVWPLIRRDSTYARRMKIRILGDSQLIQEPGPRNPLGGMKLVFWTPLDVFIHDTPFRASFNKHPPMFSHGCVRVEHAPELAELLLGWSPDSVRAAMREGRQRLVRLPRPIPVHLVYWTAWVSEDGLVAFTGDPYGWDEALTRALDSVLR
jgi:murein L,D-transpeptidase YcbB/YkuD